MPTKKRTPIRHIPIPSPDWDEEAARAERAMRLTFELNKLTLDDEARIREMFSELIGQPVEETFRLIPPFYTAGGERIRIGHKVIINQCCTIYDTGGVDIGDLVMIGPNVNLITANHPLEPSERRAYIEGRPIVIERNVWIATGVTILGGVTVGQNSVVGAGAVVTTDVPPNTFVAGVPARVIRRLDGGSRPQTAGSQ